MALISIGSFTSCGKKGESSSQGIYYVVGYDGAAKVDIQNGTAKSGGYLFISENLKDSLIVNNRKWDENGRFWVYGNLLDGIIDFPAEAMLGGGCGFTFFPEEYRFTFKMQINSYRPMTEEEKRDVPRLVNGMCYNPHRHIVQKFKLVVITSILKIQ